MGKLGSVDMGTKTMEIRRFMRMLLFLNLAAAIVSYQGWVRSYNTTMLALSYRYGFGSRSLEGTIYHLLNDFLPFDMIQYKAVLVFAIIVTALFLGFMLLFYRQVVRMVSDDLRKYTEYIILIYSLMVTCTFSGAYNFLRVDLFMIWTSLLGVLVLTHKKCEWLVIPLSAIGVMFHQGYVFMYFNLILVLLFYDLLTVETRKKRIYYFMLFAVSLVLGSVLFLWFEFFSRSDGAEIFPFVLSEAKRLSRNGIYHSTLLYHEILGIDLSASEEYMKRINYVQIVVFAVMFLPYMILLVRIFRSVIHAASGRKEKIKYWFVAIGALTMLPDFLLKVDYGRWVMSVLTYYIVMIMALLMMHDIYMENAIRDVGVYLKARPWTILLLIYPIMLLPFMDVDVCLGTRHAASWINDNFLHYYLPTPQN